MKFKLDENLPVELCDDLRALGHEADTVPDEGLMGVPDSILLEHAQSEDRVLLTMDKGIGDVLAFARRHLPDILAVDLKGWLLVVGERSIRVR